MVTFPRDTGDIPRPTELAAVADFFQAVAEQPAALLIEGEAGIGKSTVWLSALERAHSCGMRVLRARSAAAESVLAYAALADLIRGVDPPVLANLPEPQRRALDRVMLRAGVEDVATDPLAVAAGFLSVIDILTAESPVLIAIDDLQWLDTSSASALAFACARLTGQVGLLGTVRTPTDGDRAPPLPQMPRPDRTRRIRVQPLSVGALHAVLHERLGRTYSRRTMVRIHEVSAGNPLYALELARSIGDAATLADQPLPPTLADVVRTRLGALDAELQDVLLAAACAASPTVELVARTSRRGIDRTVELLEVAENKGVIGIEGNGVRFTHPLLAWGIYTSAAPAKRRETHRRLADAIEEPELRARHLALGSTHGDPRTLRSLDAAAESARSRGAPVAAAELTDLAIGLGGDTPQRRILSAQHHFHAGEPARARAELEATIAQLPPGVLRAEATSLLGYIRLLDDSFPEAVELLEGAIPDAAGHPPVVVPVLVALSFALFNTGRLDDAIRRAEESVTSAENLGRPDLLSQALSMRAMMAFLRGDGADEAGLRRAVEMEDPQANIPSAFRPRAHQAVIRAWVGELDEAHADMRSLRRQCIERGEDGELMFVAFHSAMTEIWRGNFADATLIVEDTALLAQQLGGDLPMSVTLTARALLGAYTGRADDARKDVTSALAASQRCGSALLGEWPRTALGFLEVSLGDHQAALDTLEPLLPRLRAAPNATEIITASFVADAVEAMVALDRCSSALPLVEALELNGRRLGRAWMLAVGARGRAMLSAACGDVDAAVVAAHHAMSRHEDLPMPFERARTQLLLGQLQRRQRHKEDAAATLQDALKTFEQLGTPLWANRARAELGRANVGPHRDAVLTPSERRVAELAASGLTNRGIAAAMFISPKTVEANLSRIYAKLGIHSRAELGRHMSRPGV